MRGKGSEMGIRLDDIYFHALVRYVDPGRVLLCIDIDASEPGLLTKLESLELDKPISFATGGLPATRVILTRRETYTPSLISGHSARSSHHADLALTLCEQTETSTVI